MNEKVKKETTSGRKASAAKTKRPCYGFGVEPDLAQNHFFVVIMGKKKSSDEPVEIYERYGWTMEENAENVKAGTVVFADHQVITDGDILKVQISRHKWELVAPDLTKEFNARLKAERKPAGKFAVGGTPVERMFGKEMLVLLWGIENCDPSLIPTAIKNWLGLLPEERWWLYTMTNASCGQPNDDFGWRRALMYALCENPIIESKNTQYRMFDDGGEYIIA